MYIESRPQPIGYIIHYCASPAVDVSETVNGVTTTLASQWIGISGSYLYVLAFTPTQSQVKLSMCAGPNYKSSGQMTVQQVWYDRYNYVPGTMLVKITSKPKDNYRFGYNGQEKVNDIAGIGNHNTAQFWEYDTRLGRRWNIDPVDQISVSNYAVNADNPIWYKDPLGDQATFFDIRSRQNDQRFLRGEITEAQWSQFYRDNAMAGAIGGAAWLTVLTGGRALPVLQRVGAWALMNSQSATNVAVTILGAISGYDGDLPGMGDDFARAGRKGYELLVRRGIRNDDVLRAVARNSYNAIVGTIDQEIKGLKGWESKARKAFDIRNKAKDFAREISGPSNKAGAEAQSRAKHGSSKGPSFDDLYQKHLDRGLSSDDAYKQIIESSKRTDPGTNAKYGAN